MDKALSNQATFLILLFFGALLGGYFWAGNGELAVRSYSHLHSHPNGELFIQFDNDLLAFAADGTPKGIYNLADFGVDAQGGDFAFFGNGELLIRRTTPSRDLLFNLKRFQRLSNDTPPKLLEGESNLARCNLQARQCRTLPRAAIQLNDAHALEIDRATDRIFVADSTRHRILMLDAEGVELARIESGLEFPNQIAYREGRLYVANTNNHAISIFPVTDSGFGAPLPPVNTKAPEAIKLGQIWPASVALIDDTLWVENAKNGMRDGGIYRFDAQGKFIGRSELPPDADPYAMAPLGAWVLATDFSRDRIYKLDREGALLGEFDAPPLARRVDQARENRAFYRAMKYLFIGLFGSGLVAGVLFGLIGARPLEPRPSEALRQDQERVALLSDPLVEWIGPTEPNEVRETLWVTAIIAFAVPAIILFPMAIEVVRFGEFDLARQYPKLLAAGFMSLALALAWWHQRRLRRSRIGTLGEWLILVDHRGRTAVGKGAEIGYGEAFVEIAGVVVNLRLGQYPLYAMTDLIRSVYPRLKEGRYRKYPEATPFQMKNPTKFKIGLAILFIVLNVGLVVFLFLR